MLDQLCLHVCLIVVFKKKKFADIVRVKCIWLLPEIWLREKCHACWMADQHNMTMQFTRSMTIYCTSTPTTTEVFSYRYDIQYDVMGDLITRGAWRRGGGRGGGGRVFGFEIQRSKRSEVRSPPASGAQEQVVEFFTVKNAVLNSLSMCPTLVCIRTHKNDQVRTLKIL